MTLVRVHSSVLDTSEDATSGGITSLETPGTDLATVHLQPDVICI